MDAEDAGRDDQVITAANDDTSVGAVVVTGAGRGFCAGADIGSQFAPGVEGKEREDRARSTTPAVDWVQLCRPSKPLVAAINGAASASASRWCCPSIS